MTGTVPRPGDRSLPPDAVEALEDGIRLFRAGDPEGAHERFSAAHRRAPSDPRIQSWYGLTLVTVERNSNLGVVLVDEAVRNGRPDPELIINQAQVAMALGQRMRAVRSLERGLALHPAHPDLLAARNSLGRRARPVLPFLSRRNWINRVLGRIHHGWTTRHPPTGDGPPDGGDG